MVNRPTSFEDLPRTAEGHFVLHVYAAVFRLLRHVRRLGRMGGTPLEQMLDRYPFLTGYFDEIRQHLPEGIRWTPATDWWEAEIQSWEEATGDHLPLVALGQESGLTFGSRLAFVLAGLVEEDSRFGTLFHELQAPLPQRRPTLELIGQILQDADRGGPADAWGLCRPLIAGGLLAAENQDRPRSEWTLRVPALLWDGARGELAAEPAPGCHYRSPQASRSLNELIFEPAFQSRLAKLPEVLADGQARSVVLRGLPGAEPVAVLGAVARALGRGLLVVENDSGEVPDLLGPLATMSCSLPVVVSDLGPGATRTFGELKGYSGPVGLALGLEGGLDGPLLEQAVSLNLPSPRADLRLRLWRQELGDYAGRDVSDIADCFHLDAGFIRHAARLAIVQAGLEGRLEVFIEDVRHATRTLNRQLLDTLASPMDAEGSWQRLVAGEGTNSRLHELERRCRCREQLQGVLGPAFGKGMNRGVRALFSGPSGTGKTLAARILAAELGMDLYRVDLAAVVNKYIGETEKNLHEVLTRAEALDVVLLLDEGDALLGGRTDVKSANDRYANLETNYLLQRLESFQGIVIVTTNLGANIDVAFQRRMDVVVPFFPPQAEQRSKIFEIHLPVGHTVPAQDLERMALRCELTGGQIRNAVLHTALLALDEGRPVASYHLEAGLRSEYRKAGATFPLDSHAGYPRAVDGEMETFAAALAGR